MHFLFIIFFYVTKKYIFTEMKLLIISDCYIIYVIPLWCIFLSILFFIQIDILNSEEKTIRFTDWLDAVRAMSILGLIALLISVLMTMLKLFAMKESKIAQFVAICTVFAGGKMYE